MNDTPTPYFEELNDELVVVFNNVMWIEEAALKQSYFSDITLKDMHTIDAISMYSEKSASQVAKMIHLTPSAMTTAIDRLVDKGYIERRRSDKDRRVVRLGLTHKGRVVYRAHQEFHRDLTHNLLKDMQGSEVETVRRAIHNLVSYLRNVRNIKGEPWNI
ncbi:MarR family transcriptional regulator [Leuconostoc gelidum subsp. aenigmaticum]|jgi:DNA-binding MarR family transcriptional regulator|uniref:MarR family winged helix-turn-helix transcriptional regulator n=1 Tax=Leuconostoc gelidum TaxID=1244 RepID=UPI0002191D73|nr:MarR family transcriptional regulator [Leuconostoc gelidum]MBZ5992989.1 MarR family transcriptional regulator [Leuconostoc gelidum subsp. gelidum]MBZ6000701.1 MarR family transcriptional regulator [Leuconostoc gelidum subsp. gelidum]MBZ6004150.1 MarR family transcriptional regulator [Leuconostoc gelidum subsp. aenigmaticum]MBZ6007762.1 MarR family transcriptional regulator [Leuconostoc gelidum subsp. aenigmaticum]MBZ6009581.1 MarR family transcriptional regulator [Leuconostoc gelidum subsp.